MESDLSLCPDTSAEVEAELNHILTQYRESPKLIHLIRTYLNQVAQVIDATCSIPSFFDLDTAVGDQLTIIGKRLGWVRCHCVCNIQPIIGYECEGVPSELTLAGYCDDTATWIDCGPFGSSDLCLNDDEIYRKFLKVRRYQFLSLYDIQSLTEAIQIFWGPTAMVLDAGRGRVVIAPGRDLTVIERSLIQLYPRVLPIAPGVRIRFHFGTVPVIGYGDGWTGYCEPWAPDGALLVTETGALLVTEDGAPLITGPLTRDGIWMCEEDPHPYDCAA